MKFRGDMFFGIFLIVLLTAGCQAPSQVTDDYVDDTVTNGADSSDDHNDHDDGHNDQDNGETDDYVESDDYPSTGGGEDTTIPDDTEEMGEDTGCEWGVLWEELTRLSEGDASDEEIFIAMCNIGCEELNPDSYQCL